MPTRPHLPRRAVLRLAGRSAGAAVLVSSLGALAGCTGAPSAPSPAADPVADALATVWAGEQALVARYRQVLAAFPALAPRLTGLLDDHVAHADAVRAVLDARRSAARGPDAPRSPAGPSASPRALPRAAAGALADLAGAEAAAVAAANAACLLGEGDTAALLASVAACEASHLVVLR